MYVYDLSNVAWKEFKNFNFLGIFRQTFIIVIRAVYPHSFFADPAPAVFFQSGSGPVTQLLSQCGSISNFKNLYM